MILDLAQFIIDIGIFILVWKVYKATKKEYEIPEEDHPDIDLDEFLNSLEFNMLLDGKIQPMLGKYKNEDIVKRIMKSFEKENDNIISRIDKNTLKSYIEEVLLNYNNNFQEEEYEFEGYDNDEIVEYYKAKRKLKDNNTHASPEEIFVTTNSNTVNLSNTLNNFYKD